MCTNWSNCFVPTCSLLFELQEDRHHVLSSQLHLHCSPFYPRSMAALSDLTVVGREGAGDRGKGRGLVLLLSE